ncbi:MULTISPECIES: acyl carrier protein [unclassified Streptomyces]|uniref:acyl carrier protein n=1 Tax=unclassified Streptomyces TaxID=2593676 RepID=UPI00166192F9|nr:MULTISPECIES: acyl carrier protein [unclassified Streptomyces]MBD0838361.1 acyl carrier protein [Streptomyces sp. TRM68416]
MPTEFTLADLIELLRESAGTDDTVNLDGDVLDRPFPEINYDSLAVLQTASRIEREYGVMLDEDAVADAQTPRQYLALINKAFAAAGTASA